jgi:hypothetical protein
MEGRYAFRIESSLTRWHDPDGSVSKGCLTFRVHVVNSPKRTYAQISLNGSDPAATESHGWLGDRLDAGAELTVQVIESDKGDDPKTVWKKEPMSVAKSIEEAKERTRNQIADLKAELAALEAWDPNDK